MIRAVTVAAVAFLPAVSPAVQSKEAGRLCAQAVELHQRGDLPAAIDRYRACLDANPNQPLIESNFGAALAQTGHLEEAIAVYTAALRRTDDPRLRRNLALAYYKSGALDRAIAEFETLHASAPDDLSLTLLLADSRLQAGDYRKVIDLLTPLEDSPRESRAITYLLGTALTRTGDITRGQQVMRRLLGAGDTAESRFVAATAAFVGGDYPAAVQGFARAIELNPDLPSLQSYYGQALLLTGDPDAAAEAFRRELAHNPNDFEANLKLGSILQFRRHNQEALSYLERAVRLRPSSLEARNAAAKLYVALEKWPDALAAYQTLAAEAPTFAEGHAELAKLYDRLGRASEAARERALAAATPPPPSEETGLLPAGVPAPALTLGAASLAALHRDQPVVLVFGSYTCPKFRFDAATLNRLFDRYRESARFLLVYVQEAHSEADWQSTANQREGVSLPPARTLEEKTQHAAFCTRRLSVSFPSVVDGMDRRVESAYHAWPSALYVIGRDGRIAWRSRLGEQEFSAAAFEQALAALLH